MEEKSTIRFIVNGLEGYPKLRDAARAIHLSELLDSISTVEDRLMGENAPMAEQNDRNQYKSPRNTTYLGREASEAEEAEEMHQYGNG